MHTCVGCGKQMAPKAADNLCEGCYEGLLIRKAERAATATGPDNSGPEPETAQEPLAGEVWQAGSEEPSTKP